MSEPTYRDLADLVAVQAHQLAVQAAQIERQTEQIAAQAKVITDLLAEVGSLRAEVAELKRRLGQNSRNSSRPPSGDELDRSVPRSTRKKTGRKPGKQPGGQGNTLRTTDTPDRVVDHEPVACGGCGDDLTGGADAGSVDRQVFDIPEVTVTVTEHRMHRRRCGCGQLTTADAPTDVTGPVQYGSNLRALVVYLVVYQHIPVHRAAELIGEVTGAGCSPGWISSVVAATSLALTGASDAVKDRLRQAEVLHVDETTINVGGRKWWLHVASNQHFTGFHLHQSRGRVAVNEFGVLPGYTGTVVHDAYAVYDGPGYATARHALCGAHIRRELTAAGEQAPDDAWVNAALDAFNDLNNAAHHARDTDQASIDPQLLQSLINRWEQAILCGLAANPASAGRKQTKTRNLLQRLRDRAEQVLLFARDLTVPHTNNQGERDIRPAKTQIKISGCLRSETGAAAWLRIRAHISTLRKNNINVLDGLRAAITGNPWHPAPT